MSTHNLPPLHHHNSHHLLLHRHQVHSLLHSQYTRLHSIYRYPHYLRHRHHIFFLSTTSFSIVSPLSRGENLLSLWHRLTLNLPLRPLIANYFFSSIGKCQCNSSRYPTCSSFMSHSTPNHQRVAYCSYSSYFCWIAIRFFICYSYSHLLMLHSLYYSRISSVVFVSTFPLRNWMKLLYLDENLYNNLQQIHALPTYLLPIHPSSLLNSPHSHPSNPTFIIISLSIMIYFCKCTWISSSSSSSSSSASSEDESL